jgi:hypothetical protein
MDSLGIAKVSPQYRKIGKNYYSVRKSESWYLVDRICVKWLKLLEPIIII